MKKERDRSMAENETLEAVIKQLSSQVQSLSPAFWWNIDHDELTITGNVLGTGAWGFVKEGVFHGTKVAVKGYYSSSNYFCSQ